MRPESRRPVFLAPDDSVLISSIDILVCIEAYILSKQLKQCLMTMIQILKCDNEIKFTNMLVQQLGDICVKCTITRSSLPQIVLFCFTYIENRETGARVACSHIWLNSRTFIRCFAKTLFRDLYAS